MNDDLFLGCDLLTPLLDSLSSSRLSSAEEGIVYAAGALKFLSGNPAVVKELAKQNAIETLGKIVREGVEDVVASQQSREGGTRGGGGESMAVVSNALVQITSTVGDASFYREK